MRQHFLSILYTTCLLHFINYVALAQTVQEILWVVPDGNLSDLSQTFTAGTVLPIAWNAWTLTDYIDATESLVDLWVTTFVYNLLPFSQLIVENINLTAAGNYAWTISIPESDLASTAKYVLRFKLANETTYDANSVQLSSPGFLVLAAASSTSSSSISSSTATSTTSPTNASSSTSSLSSGAKIGIGVSVGIVGLALVGAVYFFMRRGKEAKTATATTMYSPANGMVEEQHEIRASSYPTKVYPVEMSATQDFHAELPGNEYK